MKRLALSAFSFTLGVACTLGAAALYAKWMAEDWIRGVK